MGSDQAGRRQCRPVRPASPVQAMTWGLGLDSRAAEHPDAAGWPTRRRCWTRRRQGGWGGVPTGCGEDQVAIRGTGIWARRLARAPQAGSRAPRLAAGRQRCWSSPGGNRAGSAAQAARVGGFTAGRLSGGAGPAGQGLAGTGRGQARRGTGRRRYARGSDRLATWPPRTVDSSGCWRGSAGRMAWPLAGGAARRRHRPADPARRHHRSRTGPGHRGQGRRRRAPGRPHHGNAPGTVRPVLLGRGGMGQRRAAGVRSSQRLPGRTGPGPPPPWHCFDHCQWPGACGAAAGWPPGALQQSTQALPRLVEGDGPRAGRGRAGAGSRRRMRTRLHSRSPSSTGPGSSRRSPCAAPARCWSACSRPGPSATPGRRMPAHPASAPRPGWPASLAGLPCVPSKDGVLTGLVRAEAAAVLGHQSADPAASQTCRSASWASTR